MARLRQSSDLVEQMRSMRADYSASTSSRYRRTRAGLGGSADAHLDQQAYWRMREFARDMDRNDVLIGQMIDRSCDSLIYNGFTMEPDTGDAVLNESMKAYWLEWANNPEACDVTGEHTFGDMEWLIWRQSTVDGDIFSLPLDSGHLQLIEGDRCQSPRSVVNRNSDLVLGVLLSKQGRPQEYWFGREWRRDVHTNTLRDIDRYPARDAHGERLVYHVLDRKRITQSRGITAFKAAFDFCSMFEDTQFAMLVRQQVASVFGVFLKTTQANAGGAAPSVQFGSRTSTTDSQGNTLLEEELRPGLLKRLPFGVEPSEFASKIPGSEWQEHMLFIVRCIGLQIHMPLFMAIMDSSQTVFHGYRGELDLHRRSAEVAQAGFAERFHRPVWRWQMRRFAGQDQAAAKAMKKLGTRFLKVAIKPPKWRYIQPVEDARGDEIRLNILQASPRMIAAERGNEHHAIISETLDDNEFAITQAIARADKIKKATGRDVPWQQFLRLTAGQKDTPDAWAQEQTLVDADGRPVQDTSKSRGKSQVKTRRVGTPPSKRKAAA